MKTKMKMKNNRMFLALVMVAALAMVSVAGVAVIADDSDAVADNINVPASSNMALDINTSTNTIKMYISSDADASATVIFTGKGSISFGTVDANNKFTATTTVEFDGAEGYTAQINWTKVGSVLAFTVSNTDKDVDDEIAETAGTINVALGKVTFGIADYAFNGTVKAGQSTLNIANVAGVTAEVKSGTATISGTFAANDKVVDGADPAWTTDDAYYATVKIAGTANIGVLDIGANVEAVIDGNIKLMPVSTIDMAKVNSITLSNADSKLTVNGSITATTTTALPEQSGVINTQSGEIQVSGSITTTIEIANINAASYNNAASVYTYTTLENAMKASSNITINGEMFITSDTTLTGNSDSDVNNQITLAAGATLTIGSVADGAVSKATVTVPEKTTFDASTGKVNVANGQLKMVGTDTDPFDNTIVFADVSMLMGSDWVYTDVTTALSLATSGTVKLYGCADLDATISSDAEIKSGVTLDAGDNSLTIAAGGKLTVNGKLTSTGTGTITIEGKALATTTSPAKNAGELVINSDSNATVTDVSIKTLVVEGIFTIGADADVKLANMVVTVGADAVFNINGVFDFSGSFNEIKDADDSKATFNVAGKLIISGMTATPSTDVDKAIFKVTGTLQIGTAKVPVTGMYCEELYVTGNGKVIVTKDSTFTVLDKTVIGSEAASPGPNTNNATVSGVTIGTGKYAIVYGTFNEDNIVFKNMGFSAELFIKDNLYATLFSGAAVSDITVKTAYANYSAASWFNEDNTAAEGIATTVEGAVYKGVILGKSFAVSGMYNSGVTWTIDGVQVAETNSFGKTMNYGDVITVVANVDSGYSGTPSITVNGKAYTAGSEYTVTGDTVFAVSGVSEKSDSGMSTSDILLIVLVVIIALLAIVVIFKMLRS